MLCSDAQTMLCRFSVGCECEFWMLGYRSAGKAPVRSYGMPPCPNASAGGCEQRMQG